MLAKAVDPSAPRDEHRGETFGHPIAEGVVAVHHQHFFNFRLDMDVEGAGGNRVIELNAEPLPIGPRNPLGNAFVMNEKPLRSEVEARRSVRMESGRC